MAIKSSNEASHPIAIGTIQYELQQASIYLKDDYTPSKSRIREYENKQKKISLSKKRKYILNKNVVRLKSSRSSARSTTNRLFLKRDSPGLETGP